MILFLYIVKDVLFPYLLSVGVISAILLMERVFNFLPFFQAAGLEISSVLFMMMYSLMPVLTVSIPLSIIVGVYAGLNRFSTDSELVVMRASGVSISFLYRPIVFLSVVISLVTMFIVFYLCPVGLVKYENLKYNILKKHTKIQLAASQINDLFGEKLIYIFEKDGDDLKGVFIANREQPESEPIIEATRGKIFYDEVRQRIMFRLQDGKIHQRIDVDEYRTIAYEYLEYDLAPPQENSSNLTPRARKKDGGRYDKSLAEMTFFELYKGIQTSKKKDWKYFDLLDEFHGRLVTVFSVICFAIFTLPMGVVNPRSPKTGKFIYMFVLLLLYFLLYTRARALLSQGKVPVITVYFPLLISLYLGFTNFYKLNNDISSLVGHMLGGIRNLARRLVVRGET